MLELLVNKHSLVSKLLLNTECILLISLSLSISGNPKWDWFVEYKGMGWVVLLHTWLSKASNIETLVVQYERIQTNFTHELKRMLEFLDMPVSEERLKCVEAEQGRTIQEKSSS